MALKRVVVGERRYSLKGLPLDQFANAATDVQYEVGLNEALRVVFSISDGAVIDVGANIGQTLVKCLELDPDRRYIGFEPQISCCYWIERFISENDLRNYTILPLGLADNAGMVKFGLRGEHDVTASMIEAYRPSGFYSYFQCCPTARGDEVLTQLEVEKLALVKIDVEGGELEVLQGLRQRIYMHRPFIIFELLPHFLLVSRRKIDSKTREFREERHQALDRLLRNMDYITYLIDEKGSFTPAQRLEAAERNNRNYLAVPKELTAKIPG